MSAERVFVRVGNPAAVRIGIIGNDSVSVKESAYKIIEKHDADIYSGQYTVTPRVTAQTLQTENKLMQHDVTIFKIPYFSTSNESGETIYIGSEID